MPCLPNFEAALAGIRIAVVAISLAHAMSHEAPCAKNQSISKFRAPGRTGVVAGRIDVDKPIHELIS